MAKNSKPKGRLRGGAPVTLSVSISPELRDALRDLATLRQRSSSFLAREALEQYVAAENRKAPAA
jgi:predicted transcriptional regulator